MIPKPRTAKSCDFDPARWVCCKRPEKCDGTFRVYAQSFPCPLHEKCKQGLKNQYEWSYGYRYRGRYQLLSEHFGHKFAWDSRRNDLMRAFRPDYLAEKRKINRQRHGAEQDRRANAKKAAARAQRRAEPSADWARRGLLPCGEDCGNCPFGDCVAGEGELPLASSTL